MVVHLVWFPNTMRIAVGFPNLMHDHEVRPRLTRYGAGGLKPVCRLILGVLKAKCTVVGVAYSLRA